MFDVLFLFDTERTRLLALYLYTHLSQKTDIKCLYPAVLHTYRSICMPARHCFGIKQVESCTLQDIINNYPSTQTHSRLVIAMTLISDRLKRKNASFVIITGMYVLGLLG